MPAPQITADGTSLRIGPGLIGRRHEITITVLTDGGEPSLACQSPLIDVQVRQRTQERDPMPVSGVVVLVAAASVSGVVVLVLVASAPSVTVWTMVLGWVVLTGMAVVVVVVRPPADQALIVCGTRTWRGHRARRRHAEVPGNRSRRALGRGVPG